jgi:hypothetical protein
MIAKDYINKKVSKGIGNGCKRQKQHGGGGVRHWVL